MAQSMPAVQNPVEYACLFCAAGREEFVVDALLHDRQIMRAMTARTIKRKTGNGQTRRVEEIMLPGYVFAEAPACLTALPLFRKDGVIKVLCGGDADWKLYGNDRAFAEWLFKQNGLLGFSKAYKEGDRIKIISGPLKDMEGAIAKVDKRNTCGQVVLNVGGREFRVWLGFDIVEKP